MHKKWLLRIKELELKSLSLDVEERFDAWLTEHYPEGNVDYCALTGEIPQEFCSACLDRIMKQISALQNFNKKH